VRWWSIGGGEGDGELRQAPARVRREDWSGRAGEGDGRGEARRRRGVKDGTDGVGSGQVGLVVAAVSIRGIHGLHLWARGSPLSNQAKQIFLASYKTDVFVWSTQLSSVCIRLYFKKNEIRRIDFLENGTKRWCVLYTLKK
jgi:hypothetical protein